MNKSSMFFFSSNHTTNRECDQTLRAHSALRTFYKLGCSLLWDLTDLLSLLDSFVNELRERFPVEESAMAWGHVQLPFFIDHFASGDGDDRDTMALHALKDVVVHSLVVGLGWYFPTKTQSCNRKFANSFWEIRVKLLDHIPCDKWDNHHLFCEYKAEETSCEALMHSLLIWNWLNQAKMYSYTTSVYCSSLQQQAI